MAMDTDLNILLPGIQKIKTHIPDIYEKPRILLSYLFDYFPDEEEILVKYAPGILSDISTLFAEQIISRKFDSVQILEKIALNSTSEIDILNVYLRGLFEIEGISDLFVEYGTDISSLNNSKKYTIDIRKSSGEKSAEEYYQMACLQKTERGIQNINLYVELLEKASEMGHLTAKHSMALFYLKGKHVAQNIDRGFSELMECADSGNPAASYEIYNFSKRYKETIDDEIAFGYLKKAAMLNMREAEYDLAMLYYQNGVDEDYKKAIDLLERCADKNDAGAMYQLALCYRYGHGTKVDIDKAMELLKKAADLGHKTAKDILGG